jgi:hypothetical protein
MLSAYTIRSAKGRRDEPGPLPVTMPVREAWVAVHRVVTRGVVRVVGVRPRFTLAGSHPGP